MSLELLSRKKLLKDNVHQKEGKQLVGIEHTTVKVVRL